MPCLCSCRQHVGFPHVHSMSVFMCLSMCMSPAYPCPHACPFVFNPISISMFMLRCMRSFCSCTRCLSSRVGSHVCVHVHALVYVSMCMSLGVVGGFEEDPASRRLGEISDGWTNCVPSCPLSHHGECVGHGASNRNPRCTVP